MANRREIRSRIRTVKNLAQITKAMQMVAASRMRRAQARVTASRPYAEAMRDVVAQLARALGAKSIPSLKDGSYSAVELVTITPDRGFAGALVSNINRATLRFVNQPNCSLRASLSGEKGNLCRPRRPGRRLLHSKMSATIQAWARWRPSLIRC